MADKPFLISFDTKSDFRGDLSFFESSVQVPFEVKRMYWLTKVPEAEMRGDHAHKTGKQVIICLKGKVEVKLESQTGEVFEVLLSNPQEGLYLPPLWWGEMHFYDNAILLGLASDEFSEEDYIRNKMDF